MQLTRDICFIKPINKVHMITLRDGGKPTSYEQILCSSPVLFTHIRYNHPLITIIVALAPKTIACFIISCCKKLLSFIVHIYN